MMAALVMLALAAGCVLLLFALPRRGATRGSTRHARLVSRINSLLPQTQCRQCGYPGCRPYAAAIAAGAIGLDQCPPGGAGTVRQLERLMGREPAPAQSLESGAMPPFAVIDESLCIGCVKCVRACPVDAIVGAAGQMHGIIAAECTGCGLCLPPCPVDCITLESRAARPRWQWPRPQSTPAT